MYLAVVLLLSFIGVALLYSISLLGFIDPSRLLFITVLALKAMHIGMPMKGLRRNDDAQSS